MKGQGLRDFKEQQFKRTVLRKAAISMNSRSIKHINSEELAADVEEFLRNGGEIKQISSEVVPAKNPKAWASGS